MKKVLVVSKGFFHPTVFCRRQLCKTINEFTGFDTEYINNIKSIDGITLSGFDAVVLYFHEKRADDQVIDSLREYVNEGGLVLCIHGALASFKDYPEYVKLTGARFAGHDQIREMKITGIVEFTVVDEPYEFEIMDECEILLENSGLPVCWSKESGSGTVVGLSPGHKLETMKNRAFQNVIKYILNEYC